jgi:hypothetical protein
MYWRIKVLIASFVLLLGLSFIDEGVVGVVG